MKTKIIFENENLLVVYKPAGLATQSSKIGEKDVVSELKNYLKGGYVGLIHRLDQPVEGLLVFAKNKKSAAELSKQVAEKSTKDTSFGQRHSEQKNSVQKSSKQATAEHFEGGSGFIKEYMAAVFGEPHEKSGRLENYIIKKDSSTAEIIKNISADNFPAHSIAGDTVSDEKLRDAKRAVLNYEVIKSADTEFGKMSLLKINLETGRFHQIRVQMAGAGMPLLGDRKYGNEESISMSERLGVRNIALCAERLAFVNPEAAGNKKDVIMEFSHKPENEIYKFFND